MLPAKDSSGDDTGTVNCTYWVNLYQKLDSKDPKISKKLTTLYFQECNNIQKSKQPISNRIF